MYTRTYNYRFNKKMPPSLPSPHGGGGGNGNFGIEKNKKLGTKWWSH